MPDVVERGWASVADGRLVLTVRGWLVDAVVRALLRDLGTRQETIRMVSG